MALEKLERGPQPAADGVRRSSAEWMIAAA